MQLTAELSLYPLDENYIPPIKAFIDRLHQHPSLTVVGNAMSTQVRGDYDDVMAIISQEMKTTFSDSNKAIMVCKFINGALPIDG